VNRKWDELYRRAVKQLESFEKVRGDSVPVALQEAVEDRDAATVQSSLIAAVDAIEPDDSTAAATVRRLAGAIKTNPEGTEAGIVVAPFALAGHDSLRGLEVTFAALKDDFTRAGVSYTWDRSPTLEDVWRQPDACPATDARRKALEAPRDFYLNACIHVVAELPDDIVASVEFPAEERTNYQTRINRARLACGLPTPVPFGPEVATLPEAISLLRTVVETANEVAVRTDDVIRAQAGAFAMGLRADAAQLENWTIPGPTACFTKDRIRAYFQQLYWTRRKWKVALGASWDLFPRKFGFSPDESTLSRGEAKTREVRFDASTGLARTELSFGIGVGSAREDLTDDLRAHASPSISLAHAFSLLKSKPLTSNGQLNTEDGDLPPRLVAGLSVATQFAIDKRASQTTRFNSVEIQPHLDFLISETLSFRLGIPIEGEIAVRKKQDAVAASATSPERPEVPEQRSLQWTIPVAIVAVIKM
jgi:hypothetical protein